MKNKIALNLPQSVPILIVYGRHVVKMMSGNVWFPDPTPPLDEVSLHLDALQASEVTAHSKTIGAAAARDLDKKVVENDMTGLQGYVQLVLGQHPEEEAIAILASSGMSLKRVTLYHKPQLSARMGAPQEVLLWAKAVGARAAYEWQCSVNGGDTWIPLGTTTVANTSAKGLTVGATYLFRFRSTKRKTTTDWSQTIHFLVH